MEEMHEFLFSFVQDKKPIVVFTRLREVRDAVFTFSIIPNSIYDTLCKQQIWIMNTCVATPRLCLLFRLFNANLSFDNFGSLNLQGLRILFTRILLKSRKNRWTNVSYFSVSLRIHPFLRHACQFKK